MRTVLIINGAESRPPMAAGNLNAHLVRHAQSELSASHNVLVTTIADGYSIAHEQEKFKSAEVIIFQFPVFWFSQPPGLKRYIDDVYQYGVFFGPSEHYGRGGLLHGKSYLLSTTWNAQASDFGSPDTILGPRTPDEVFDIFHVTNQYVGMTPLPSFAEHNVVQGPDADGAAMRIRQHLRLHVIEAAQRDPQGAAV